MKYSYQSPPPLKKRRLVRYFFTGPIIWSHYINGSVVGQTGLLLQQGSDVTIAKASHNYINAIICRNTKYCLYISSCLTSGGGF